MTRTAPRDSCGPQIRHSRYRRRTPMPDRSSWCATVWTFCRARIASGSFANPGNGFFSVTTDREGLGYKSHALEVGVSRLHAKRRCPRDRVTRPSSFESDLVPSLQIYGSYVIGRSFGTAVRRRPILKTSATDRCLV